MIEVEHAAPAADWLIGGGEMGERMRAKDWSQTPLGPLEAWPQSLRTAAGMMLPSKAQIILFWGSQYVVLYNDAYRPVFGANHPQVLGKPGHIAWSEIWDTQLHPQLAGVVRTGEAFAARDLLLVIERHGCLEEAYFDVSYDPVRLESGEVGGVYCIATETTGRVVGERRLALLHDLAARNATARSAREACVLAMETLASRPQDIPYAAAYLEGKLQAATPGERPAVVKELPIASDGTLVAALNPRRPFDAQYLSFLDLVAHQLATAIANAQAYDQVHGARMRRATFDDVREKLEEMETLMNTLPVGVFIARDPACKNIDMNPAGAAMLRLSPGMNASKSGSESAQLPFRVFREGVEVAAEDLSMQRAARLGTPVVGEEVDLVFADGSSSTLYEHAVPLFGPDGSTRGCVGVFVDITERKRAEKALRSSEARFRSLAAMSSDWYWEQDEHFRFVQMSDEVQGLAGSRSASHIGKTRWELPHVGVTEQQWAEHRALLERHEPFRGFEYQRTNERGDTIWMSASGDPIFDADGRFTGYRGTGTNITERKAAEEALREADRRKDEFMAMLAHELRNPLAAIALGAELLKLARLEDPKARFAAPAIERQVKQLQRLADDMLDMARVTYGKLALKTEHIDLLHSARAVAALHSGATRTARIEVAGDQAWANADPARVQQMIGNLIENAVKYGGKRIEVRVRREDAWSRLSVSDDGQGIPAALLRSLFKPFVQGEQPLDRAQGGLGLGLSLVHRLAALHGGSVEAHSEGPGNGSTFTISLPAVAGPVAGDPKSPSVGRTLKRRVLLIEDEKDVRDMLKLVLESEGHEVSAADSGAEGLARLGSFRPDIALVDIGLPGMDGYEVARRARSAPGGERIRLIAISGYGQDKDRQRAREAGFDQHVTKPVAYEQLMQVFQN